ncbi:hypothetical protein SAMN05428936_1014 [Pelagibacterium halotolerans]|uniref:Uncharacterized protein n=2 Tax=Pelagibacterium TaxID=1082930 RepID=G4REX0_PELHB|nr:hypothetical protein KKY_1931 [Pelagibacterium halotolerans B2]SDZ80074.1 hypothetical protein SAMN05428936_1014 [Pelagibacterium halotolerans]
MRPTILKILAFAALFASPAMAQEAEGMTSAPMIGASLTEKFWVQSEQDAGLPGSMVVFLSEGTMLQDSCWETYRLSNWQMTGEESLSWQEDTMTIEADIVELNEAELVLALHLVGGEIVEKRYAASPVPYVCPDMPR